MRLLVIALLLVTATAQARPLSFSNYDESIKSASKKYWVDFPDWQFWKAQLYQESQLDPNAVSGVGAKGLAQFMPGTWEQITRELGWSGIGPNQAQPAIEAGAYYMLKLRRGWSSPRPETERHRLAVASYNAGPGSLIKAQKLCGNVRDFDQIAPCLPFVTGSGANETITYVQRIWNWRAELGR